MFCFHLIPSALTYLTPIQGSPSLSFCSQFLFSLRAIMKPFLSWSVKDFHSGYYFSYIWNLKQAKTCKIWGFHGGDYEEWFTSRMLRRVALVRTDVSEEPSDSFIRVTRIGELGALAATSNRHMLRRNTSSPILVTLMKEALGSSGTSVLTRATRLNIVEDTVHQSQKQFCC
jgi:hypothetical protein